MKKGILTIIGVTCCAGSVYAAGFQDGDASPSQAVLSLSGTSRTQAFLSAASPAPVQALTAQSSRLDLGQLAFRISYIGSLILTADRVVRSVDSVLDGMEVTRDDGTRLKLLMEPGSGGFDVMLKMSRPLEF
jgi:hypothetical protein